ncbi:hypothetical protein FACS1894187_03580 [Synergistales bacterium]|nr:hypothetical protein FACS1894187_03580 [Synergistales bacterium]
MQAESYLYKKDVDWSALHLGINIPVSLQEKFYQTLQLRIAKGETRKITLIVENTEYQATLSNISFDKRKYPNHKDLLQIRYTPNSDIAQKLREIHFNSFIYLSNEKSKLQNHRQKLSVPIEMREYLVIYYTQFDDVFLVECITAEEISDAKIAIRDIDEMAFEQLISTNDYSAGIIEMEKLVKIRKLDKTIGNRLKQLYSYSCQVCGLYVGERYSAQVIHTHHIDAFSRSFNNNPENILVVCPNHHGIIHATNPLFDRMNLTLAYPNGYVEKLQLNVHL